MFRICIFIFCLIVVLLDDASLMAVPASNLYIFAVPKPQDTILSPIVQFRVTDPLGRRTGYDPNTNQKFIENSNASYWETGVGDSPINSVEYSYVGAVNGLYKIKLIGTGLGYYRIIISYPRPLGIRNLAIGAYTDIGKVDEYEFNYNYAQGLAGTPPTFTRIINSASLIADINILSKLGYIGNAKFVNELIKEFQEIENERTKPLEKDEHLTPAQKAIKEYKELLKEITEKYQKPEADEFVKEEAYTVLKEDLGYIIAHI